MQNLEAQLHTLLEEIAQDAHTHEEQAIIIATAASIINKRFTSRRLAKMHYLSQCVPQTHGLMKVIQKITSMEEE